MKKNLLFIFSDQHRKFDLGCYGNDEVLTPNLDRLANEGIRFENCCSNSPVCVPARGTILTGLYAQKHGAYTNDLQIRYDIESIADVLNRAGYHTGYIGKWHLCGVPRDQFIEKERRLGFQEWKVANCNHNYLNCYYDDEENCRHWIPGYEPEIFGELAVDFLERNIDNEKPFALFLAFATPHDPHNIIGDKYADIYRKRAVSLRPNSSDKIMVDKTTFITKEKEIEMARGYYGHITAIDEQIGRLMNFLEKSGKKDDTLVVYTADHGEMLGSHGTRDKQLPYEESIGIPLIFSCPKQLKAEVRKDLIGIVDIPVTVAGILGLSFTNGTDGKNVFEFKNNECYMYDLYAAHQAYRKGYFAWRAIRTDQYTYAVNAKGEDWLLFDNQKDPYQQNNLIADPCYELVKKELFEILKEYVEELDGFMDGDDYVKYTGKLEEFNVSQIYFSKPVIL